MEVLIARCPKQFLGKITKNGRSSAEEKEKVQSKRACVILQTELYVLKGSVKDVRNVNGRYLKCFEIRHYVNKTNYNPQPPLC